MSSRTYAIKRYKVLASESTEFDKSVVVSMNFDQLTAIQGFLSLMGDGITLEGGVGVMYTISIPGEADDEFVWSS